MRPLQPTRCLTANQKEYIISLPKTGNSYNTIIQKCRTRFHKTIYKGTISKIKQKSLVKGNVEKNNNPIRGRPPIYNDREQRNLVRKSLKKPTTSIHDLTIDPDINPKGAGKSTIHNMFRAFQILSRVISRRNDDMTRKNMVQRLKFAREHLDWERSEWNLVVFADEADLFPIRSGKSYIHFRGNQKRPVIEAPEEVPTRKITIKVLGFISSLGVGPLIRYNGTMDKIKYRDLLQRHLFQAFPFLENPEIDEMGADDQLELWKFMDDNAKPHRAKIISLWKKDNGVLSLGSPAKSPDLNIVENIWSYIQDQLYGIRERLKSADDT